MKLTTYLQGAGVAALVLFPLYGDVIDSPSDLRMHTTAPVTTFVLSIVVNLILISFVFAFGRIWLRKRPRWIWLKLLFPGLVLASLAEMFYFTRVGTGSVTLWIVVLAIVTCLTVSLHWRWQAGERRLLQLADGILIGLGFFCLFIVLQLLYLATWRPMPNSIQKMTASASDSSNHPRIVWILFDELSYNQTFGHRYPNLQLPNFDKLRKSSTVFTNVQPVVNETEKAVPSMLLGQRVDRVKYTFGNRLKVGIGNGALQPFDAARTPFALARRDGLTTGVVGWYNPYCDMLAPYLNECYSTDELLAPTVFAKEGFWENFLQPWLHYGAVFNPLKRKKLIVYHLEVYRDLLQHASSTLQPSGPDFVLLHFPVPHPPAFYNRSTQQFDTSGNRSYIDSLALADKTLGQVLTILQQSPRWKNTSIVICGDHSWRTYTWSHTPYWTAEDQTASHGAIFDPRPMLMVHLAGQTTAATVNTPFPLLRVHTILDNLAEGKRPPFLSATH